MKNLNVTYHVKKEENSEVQKERAFIKDSPSFIARTIHLKKFLPRNLEVLDIGCGNGFMAELLYKNGCTVDGLDIDPETIEIIKKKFPKGNWQVSDFENYKPTKKYDVIICTEVLEHIKEDNVVIKLMHDWLKDNGKLIVSVPIFKYTITSWEINRHYRHYTKKSITKKLENNNFKIIEIKLWGSWFRYYIEKMHETNNETKKNERKTKSSLLSFYKSFKFLIIPIIKLETKLTTFFLLRKEGCIVIAYK